MAMRSLIQIRWSCPIVISVMVVTLLVCLGPAFGAVSCTHRSKLAYYYSDYAVKVGACGFGDSAEDFYSGNVAAVSPSLFKSGRGCSVCYQIRCVDPNLCNKSGAKVVVTDMTSNDQTEFVVPKYTYESLALPDKSYELLHAGIIDIEYKRIFCEYKGCNLVVKVHEISQYPHFLALEFLYQGGQTEIVLAEVATVGSNNWRSLRRNFGAVWDISNPPNTDLQFRLVVTSGYDGYTLWAKKAVMPACWTIGGLYDTGLQINQTDIGGNGCYKCDDSAKIG